MATVMTPEEMKAAGERYQQIERAKQDLKEATERLAYFNKHAAEDRAKHSYQREMTWNVTFRLKTANDSWGRDVTIDVMIPFGVVQQQLVYAVERARRELIRLGGTP